MGQSALLTLMQTWGSRGGGSGAHANFNHDAYQQTVELWLEAMPAVNSNPDALCTALSVKDSPFPRVKGEQM